MSDNLVSDVLDFGAGYELTNVVIETQKRAAELYAPQIRIL